MSRLAKEYIEKSFKLSRSISTVERDLSNGYLLLTIAHSCEYLSDDEFESARDDNSPTCIIKNFKLLGDALNKIGIHLTKSDIAQIISEQPGTAAGVVLKLKHHRETGGKRVNSVTHKDGLKSLRPKSFIRLADHKKTLGPEETFIHDAKDVIATGVFSKIHMKCQANEYETFKHRVQAKVHTEKEEEKEMNIQIRDERRQAYLAQTHTVIETRKDKEALLKQNWTKTQDDKRQRQIRDLQFDQASQKIEVLKRGNTSKLYSAEVTGGIDKFEKLLVRNGIAGGDDNGDGTNLTMSYEDGSVFLRRVEETAVKNWPSNEDVNNFVEELKDRTREKRNGRYEKARRRRRMLVQQASLASADDFNGLIDDTFEAAELAEEEEVLRKQLKEQKLRDDYERYKESLVEIEGKADASFAVFAEDCRKRCEESGERGKAMRSVKEARDLKVANKRDQVFGICNTIVLAMVNDVIEKVEGSVSSLLIDFMNSSPLDVAREINKLSQRLLTTAGGKGDEHLKGKFSLKCLYQSDEWQPFSALAVNLGKWSNSSNKINAISSNITEEEVQVEGEEERVNTTRSSSGFSRKTSFLESIDLCLNELALKVCGKGDASASTEPASADSNPLALSPSESDTLKHDLKIASKYILVFCDDYISLDLSMGSIISQSREWMKKSSVSVCWDLEKSISIGQSLKPHIEGKVPSLTFGVLCEIISNGLWSCPPALVSNASLLSQQLLKVVNEIIEISSRILASSSLIGTDKFSLSMTPFTMTSFSILMGQTLWLRSFVIDNIKRQAPDDFKSLPVENIVFITLRESMSVGNESVFLRSMDWFMRGNTKEAITDSEGELLQAVSAEANSAAAGAGAKVAAPAKKGKPPAKVKGEVDLIFEISFISNLVWITSSSSSPIDGMDSKAIAPLSNEQSNSGGRVLEEYSRLLQVSLNIDNRLKASEGRERSLASTILAVKAFEHMKFLKLDYKVPSNNIDNNSQSNNEEANELSNGPAILALTALPVSSEVSVSEALISSLISSLEDVNHDQEVHVELSQEQEAAVPLSPDSSHILHLNNYMHQVQCTIERRRSSLKASDKLFLLHALKQFPLDENKLNQSRNYSRISQACVREYFGLHLMSFLSCIKHFERVVLAQESNYIFLLKSVDPRWKTLCAAAENKLNHVSKKSLSGGDQHRLKEIDLIIKDLICRVGDVIDERHIQWIEIAENVRNETFEMIGKAVSLIEGILNTLGESVFKVFEQNKIAVDNVCELLENAGYTQYPLPLSQGGKSRVALDMKKGNLRSIAIELAKKLRSGLNTPTGRINKNEKEVEEEMENAWTSLTAMELPLSSAVGTMKSTLLIELYSEILDVATVLLSGLQSSLKIIESDVHAMLERVHSYIHKRYSYEHSVLNQWAAELKESYLQAPVSVAVTAAVTSSSKREREKSPQVETASSDNFLSKYHFGVSDDSHFDKIPLLDNYGLVKTGDLKIPLDILSKFSKFIFKTISQKEWMSSQVKRLKPVEANVLVVTLVRLLQTLVSSAEKSEGIYLHKSWSDFERLKSMISVFAVESTNEKVLEYPINEMDIADLMNLVRNIFKHVIEALVFANVPLYPPVSYIARVGRIFSRPGAEVEAESIAMTAEAKVPLETFISVYMAHEKLNRGWWNFGKDLDAVKNVIRILAITCCDEFENVKIEEFLQILCKTPSFLLSKLHERSILLSPSVGLSNDDTVRHEGTTHSDSLPTFLDFGDFRIFNLSKSVEEDELEVEPVCESQDFKYCFDICSGDAKVKICSGSGGLLRHQILWSQRNCGRNNFSFLENQPQVEDNISVSIYQVSQYWRSKNNVVNDSKEKELEEGSDLGHVEELDVEKEKSNIPATLSFGDQQHFTVIDRRLNEVDLLSNLKSNDFKILLKLPISI